MKKIPIGKSDFKSLIEDGFYYIDKSLLIKDIINDGADVILLPRPRRFGKTLSISMLKCFFEKPRSDKEPSYLFNGLAIEEESMIMDEHCGKYPVIYINFKDEKYSTLDEFKNGIKNLVKRLCLQYEYLLESDKVSTYTKKSLVTALEGSIKISDIGDVIKILIDAICAYHNQRIIVLIDEYDTPVHHSYTCGYYDEAISIMVGLFSALLKDNNYLKKGIVTGILRIAKESIFSGLNNLKVRTILNEDYGQHFGFTESEVIKLLDDYKLTHNLSEVKKWYNGYIFGSTVIYNPWSILNYIDEKQIKAYWVNTSSNDLIKNLLIKSGEEVKKDLMRLIKYESIEKKIDENIIFKDLEREEESIYSLLLFSGYLKITGLRQQGRNTFYELSIPNEEVLMLYEDIISSYFSESYTNTKFQRMLNSLVNSEFEIFSSYFKEFIESSMDYYGIRESEPEKVYQTFVLGMLVALSDIYSIKSELPSGYGRTDIILIPKDRSRKGFIIEFKKVNSALKETIEKSAEEAIKQIRDKKYIQFLTDLNVQNTTLIGMAFEGKKVEIVFEEFYL